MEIVSTKLSREFHRGRVAEVISSLDFGRFPLASVAEGFHLFSSFCTPAINKQNKGNEENTAHKIPKYTMVRHGSQIQLQLSAACRTNRPQPRVIKQ